MDSLNTILKTPLQKRYDSLSLLGRIMLSSIFVLSGLGKIGTWQNTQDYMLSQGMVWVPFFLASAIVVEVLGGLSILLGYRARIGATALALYLIPVTAIFHPFWSFSGMDLQMQMIQFWKNIAIMGGLYGIAAFGAGAVSFDARREEKLEEKRLDSAIIISEEIPEEIPEEKRIA